MATCTNCGAVLPDDARFCPRCTAPVVGVAASTTAETRSERGWGSRAEQIALAVLGLLLLALVVLLVLVFGFGILVDDGS